MPNPATPKRFGLFTLEGLECQADSYLCANHLILLESGARHRALLLGLLNCVQKSIESRFMLLVLIGQFLRCSLVQPEFLS